jgi:alpha/beta superfamily hydrolase
MNDDHDPSQSEEIPTAATLYKHKGCPICSGDFDPEQRGAPDTYRKNHIKIDGEYFEVKDTFGRFDKPQGELVRRQDAYDYVEERENKAHKAGYEKGKGIGRHEGREEERQRITELIKKHIDDPQTSQKTSLAHRSAKKELEELLDEVEKPDNEKKSDEVDNQ